MKDYLPQPSMDLAQFHSIYLRFSRTFPVITFWISKFFGLSITQETKIVANQYAHLMHHTWYRVNFSYANYTGFILIDILQTHKIHTLITLQ
jgi:hypothetical protein